jgi:SAM-dependent methyltransferase
MQLPPRHRNEMDKYDPAMSFGEDTAERYDEIEQRGDEDVAVSFLERHARGGPALELAIGTGRIAMPLAERGIRVDGIDFSPAMVARLLAKPGGEAISVKMGDFADVDVINSYQLIYIVFNTLFNLLSQDKQVRCFENVARHLTNDGRFVVEAFVPAFLYRTQNSQYVKAEEILTDRVRLDVLRHDASKQMIDENHVSLTTTGVRFNPIVQRYSWPSELDLMARIAGLQLKERWSSWRCDPFTPESNNCVSVFCR